MIWHHTLHSLNSVSYTGTAADQYVKHRHNCLNKNFGLDQGQAHPTVTKTIARAVQRKATHLRNS